MRYVMNKAWEDSIGYHDMRAILYVEAIERLHATAHYLHLCWIAPCKRHRLCLGPMVQQPGQSLPRPWKQNGETGFRPFCMQFLDPPLPRLTAEQLLQHGPAHVKVAESIPALGYKDFLGNRIARSRAKRNGSKAGPWPFTPLETDPATRQSCRASRRSRRRR